MTVTIDSANSSYLPVAEFLKRCDKRTVGDLVSDTGTRVAGAALASDENLAAALKDASGLFESAVLVGRRYTQADLTTIAAADCVARARMYRILTDLAMCYLYGRRPDKGDVPSIHKVAYDDLELLRQGERIFGTVEHEAAGLRETHVETPAVVDERNGLATMAQRFFGRRGSRR